MKNLRKVVLKGCYGLTNDGISKFIYSLPNLSFLDVRFVKKLNNSILEAALSHETAIVIKCSDTNVDPVKFVYNHSATRKTNIDRDLYEYSVGNLKFETLASRRVTERFNDDIWDEDNGYFYMGSEFEDSDNESYFPGDSNQRKFADRNNGDQLVLEHLAGEDEDESDPDDFDDFINNEETEMYNELDEY